MTGLDTGRNRTRAILRHAGLGVFAQAFSVLASIAALPLMLRALGTEHLGAWLMLFSFFQWVTLFDLGVSAGARNEIARALAGGDHPRARLAISTGWTWTAGLVVIGATVAVVLLSVLPVGQWLGMSDVAVRDFDEASRVVVVFAALSFGMGYVQSVYGAFEKGSAGATFSAVSNGLFLVLLLSTRDQTFSVARMAWMYGCCVLLANGILIAQYWVAHPQHRPAARDVSVSMAGRMLNFGMRLFVIQLAALVIFATHRWMAGAWLGPAQVVVYDVAFKVFSIFTVAHGILMTAIWSSFTQAWEQRQLDWLWRTIRTLSLLMIPTAVAAFALAWLAPTIIASWMGPMQVGEPQLYLWFAVMTVLGCWCNIFAYFLNGIGRTRVQMATAVLAGISVVPAADLFVNRFGQGLVGIPMATVLVMCLFTVAGPLHVAALLRTKAKP